MKRFINKFKQFTIISIATIAVLLLILKYGDGKNEFVLGLIGVLISLSYGSINVSIEQDRIFKELFTSYTNLYNVEFNDKLIVIVKMIEKDSNATLSDLHKKTLNDYLNLCSEQYLWYSKGRIPNRVWISWSNGMVYYFQFKQINDFIKGELNNKESYYGFLDYLILNKVV